MNVDATRAHILIVEDDPELSALLDDCLKAENYSTCILSDGREVVPHVRSHEPAVVLLDLMLPGQNGLDICRELRTFSSVPVIVTSARVEEIDRLLGLELGADDYVCKPYSSREVVARVKAVLRRSDITRQARTDAPQPFILDPEHRIARLGGTNLNLTYIELRLLELLQSAPGQILSRDQLLSGLYDDRRVVTDRTIDSHIKNLRRKLQAVRPDHEFIRSIYGVGYRFEREDEKT
ncbi:response regulator [Burkholderia pseudomallei]|uniref:response regulator n=1 Tax=Burkholderia pseudomallei TaxID=28450 RepID=UPI001AD780D1|nr:response regulator [Burkholderia pseudomallei]MBO7752773.1 response regulator [Burkholderia pseudomallei]MBO7804341.1 response regulator [Burkholderia pseudomallei]MBO7932024.1 response regulator [Burkholderia pseudomallei]